MHYYLFRNGASLFKERSRGGSCVSSAREVPGVGGDDEMDREARWGMIRVGLGD